MSYIIHRMSYIIYICNLSEVLASLSFRLPNSEALALALRGPGGLGSGAGGGRGLPHRSGGSLGVRTACPETTCSLSLSITVFLLAS